MPFGLTSAPRVFQRYINTIFSDLIRRGQVLVYLDDILIGTDTVEEYLQYFKKRFQIDPSL